MKEKVIETEHYRVIISDGTNDMLLGDPDLVSYGTLVRTEIYLNTDYYKTKKDLATKITQVIIRNEGFQRITDDDSKDDPELDIEERHTVIGEELIDILGQL